MHTETTHVSWWQFGSWESVNWGGVFAGLVIMLVTQMLLSTLGVAIGLSALEPATSTPGAGFGWSAAAWAVLSLSVALFLGGYVAGRFGPTSASANGALSGTLVWGLSFLFGIYLVSTGAQAFSSGLFGVMGQSTQINEQTRSRLEGIAQSAGVDVDALQRRVESTVDAAAANTRAATTPGTAEHAQARQAADRAVDATATASWLLLGGSLLGLAIAAWAGSLGQRSRVIAVGTP